MTIATAPRLLWCRQCSGFRLAAEGSAALGFFLCGYHARREVMP